MTLQILPKPSQKNVNKKKKSNVSITLKIKLLNLFQLFSLFRFLGFRLHVSTLYWSDLGWYYFRNEKSAVGHELDVTWSLTNIIDNHLPFKINLPLERSEKATNLLRQKVGRRRRRLDKQVGLKDGASGLLTTISGNGNQDLKPIKFVK